MNRLWVICKRALFFTPAHHFSTFSLICWLKLQSLLETVEWYQKLVLNFQVY